MKSKKLIKAAIAISLLVILGLGSRYLLSEIQNAVPPFDIKTAKAGQIYSLAVTMGQPCLIDYDPSKPKPQSVDEIDADLRNLSLLLDSSNIKSETYTLQDLSPYEGPFEVEILFYGDRVLAIDTRGASGADIIKQRYSLNSKSTLVEHLELRLSAQEAADDQESIRPVDFRYDLTQTNTTLNYGCILRQKSGSTEKREYTDRLELLFQSELRTIPIEDTNSVAFTTGFIAILAGVKAQRAKNAKDALFKAADLPVLDLSEAQSEGTSTQN